MYSGLPKTDFTLTGDFHNTNSSFCSAFAPQNQSLTWICFQPTTRLNGYVSSHHHRGEGLLLDRSCKQLVHEDYMFMVGYV